jgi:hypothetical protein
MCVVWLNTWLVPMVHAYCLIECMIGEETLGQKNEWKNVTCILLYFSQGEFFVDVAYHWAYLGTWVEFLGVY